MVRSLRSALGRRIALGSPLVNELRELEAQLEELKADTADRRGEIAELEAQIHHLRGRIWRIPFIDPFDLRYVNRVKQPQPPSSQAVMFCLMDVSGSMDEQRKDLAKRFFILLYLFLKRNYEKIEVVFIRHHTRAEEVDEDTFFHSTESGGTVVSSALELMRKVMDERYPPSEWNIYGAQASDGDNWNDDSPKCRKILENDILTKTRYFAYIQVTPEEQNLWLEYAQLALSQPHMAMKKVDSAADIYPVFRELFEKQVETTPMTTRHLHNEARGYQARHTGDDAPERRPEESDEAAEASSPLPVMPESGQKEGRMNVAERKPLPCPLGLDLRADRGVRPATSRRSPSATRWTPIRTSSR